MKSDDARAVYFYYFPLMNAELHHLDHGNGEPDRRAGLHRVALIVAWCTFPLIFIGGLVTSKDAGLSVPDWPNSYGYNMFAFPPRLWTGNIFYEHTHRLYASFVGLLTVLLAGWTLYAEKRRWVRWLGVSCLSMVIIQGVLGGLRVVLLKLNLAIVHACVAQAFFCLVMLMCLVTSKWWMQASAQRSADAPGGQKLVRLAVVTWVIVFLQLMLGATMRHYRAGLAIPDVPLSFGHVLPPTNATDLKIEQERIAAADPALDLDESTLTQVWLAFGHRMGALLVSAATITLAVVVLRKHRRAGLIRPAMLLIVLLLLQVTLGVLTVLWKKPADVASAHVAVGALVLVTTFVLAVRSMRLYSPVKVGNSVYELSLGHDPQPGRLNGPSTNPAIS
jgi:cytochrome c oxidase assembly protein subunit 15